MKEFGPPGGGARVPGAPLDPPMIILIQFLNYIVIKYQPFVYSRNIYTSVM